MAKSAALGAKSLAFALGTLDTGLTRRSHTVNYATL